MGEKLAYPGAQLRVSDAGIAGAEAAGLELPGQRQQLIGDSQLALCGHGSEPPGLELANHGIDVVHAGIYPRGAASGPEEIRDLEGQRLGELGRMPNNLIVVTYFRMPDARHEDALLRELYPPPFPHAERKVRRELVIAVVER